MNKRDKMIIANLNGFKVLNRDQIIKLHFNDQKQPTVTCNRVMKRLVREGHCTVNAHARPYDYFTTEKPIKKDSAKQHHYKRLADFLIEIQYSGLPLKEFWVEPTLGDKGTVEPDIYMFWNKAPFFVEVQNSAYTKSYMQKKFDRYKEYYDSGEWKEMGQHFPYIWIISERPYNVDFHNLRVFQSKNVEDFRTKYFKKKS